MYSLGRCCMAHTMDTFLRLPRLSSRIRFQVSRRLVVEGTTAELDIENKFFDYYEGRA